MKIETKYNIGDEVYFNKKDIFIKGIIIGILIDIPHNDFIRYEVEYHNKTFCTHKKQDELKSESDLNINMH